MSVSDEQVREILREILVTMAGLDGQARPWPPFGDLSHPVLSGCVQIAGSWEGAVVVDCPAPLARRAAAAMLGIGEQDCTRDDLADVVAELANMTGGNVKGLLSGRCALSLPAVAEGSDYMLRLPHTRVVATAALDCAGTLVRAAVHERIG